MLVDLPLEVAVGLLLPECARVWGVVDPIAIEEIAEHEATLFRKIFVERPMVFFADGAGVVLVLFGGCTEDGEVDVGEDFFTAHTCGVAVLGGEDEGDCLGAERVFFDEVAEQCGAGFFVVGAAAVVDDVMEPDGELDHVRIHTNRALRPRVPFFQAIVDVVEVVVRAVLAAVEGGDGVPNLISLRQVTAPGKFLPAILQC